MNQPFAIEPDGQRVVTAEKHGKPNGGLGVKFVVEVTARIVIFPIAGEVVDCSEAEASEFRPGDFLPVLAVVRRFQIDAALRGINGIEADAVGTVKRSDDKPLAGERRQTRGAKQRRHRFHTAGFAGVFGNVRRPCGGNCNRAREQCRGDWQMVAHRLTR